MPSALAQLGAVEQCLSDASGAQRGDVFRSTRRWAAETSEHLREVGLSEQALGAYSQLLAHLTSDGVFAYTDEGRRRSYEERKAAVRDLAGQLREALAVARRRLEARVGSFEGVAEAAIRAAARAQILSAQGSRGRDEWLALLANRMADHPESAPHLARLGLRVSDAEVRALLDRVLRRVFGV